LNLNPHPSNVVISVASLSANLFLVKRMVLIMMALALTACASAPVQEMSDARQAIYSAEAAGAMQRARATLQMAQHLLQEAQIRLEAGAYDDARQHALDARNTAIKAREQATTAHLPLP